MGVSQGKKLAGVSAGVYFDGESSGIVADTVNSRLEATADEKDFQSFWLDLAHRDRRLPRDANNPKIFKVRVAIAKSLHTPLFYSMEKVFRTTLNFIGSLSRIRFRSRVGSAKSNRDRSNP